MVLRCLTTVAGLAAAGFCAAAPANDNFAGRITLTGSTIFTNGSNVAATKETGEPNHGGNAGGKSVWWSWTAPFSGGVTLSTAGSEISALLGVYTGTTVSTLVLVASDGRQNLPGIVTFRAIAGVNYKIAIDGYNGAAGALLLSLDLRTWPANDNFANRTAINTGPIVIAQNVGATRESGETNHAGIIGGKSVWWTWTAPSNGWVNITTAGSDFDTLLGVYTNSALSNLTAVAANDDARREFSSSILLNAVAGRVYQIAVDGFNNAGGNIQLQIIPLVAATNDAFANPATLSGTNITLVTTNTSATKESGEPNHNGNAGGKSLWWEWQAPASGGASIDLAGSDFSTLLAVYTGNSLPAVTSVVSSFDRVLFKATSGTKYRIAVDGAQVGAEPPQSGRINLNLRFAPSPTNDDFANRLVLGTNANGFNIGASSQTNEPFLGQELVPPPISWGRTVWYSWTASATGPAAITTRSSNLVSVIAVFTGTNVAALTRVASHGGLTPTNSVIFRAVSGVTYQIAIDGIGGAMGYFSVSPSIPAAPGNNDFAKRYTLAGLNTATNGWNVGATDEPGEPDHAGVPGTNSIWWSWTSPNAGRLFLTTIGSSVSPMLALYQGTQVSNLTARASGYIGSGCPRFSIANLDVAAAGQTTQIAIDSPPGVAGGIDLGLIFVPKPANDNFAAAQAITGASLVVTGSVVAATQEAGEIIDGMSNGLRTVWYNWTAPTNLGLAGGVTLRITGIDFGPPDIGIFQGNSLASLSNVVALIESKGNISQVTFQATAGATYRIAVAGPDTVGTGYDRSFAKRRGGVPPAPLNESGTFVLRLNFSSLALRIVHSVPGEVAFLDRTRKVPFGTEAQVVNYGTQASLPVRVRLVGLDSSGQPFGSLGTFLPLTAGTVGAGATLSLPLNSACPVGIAVLAVLEEELGGTWFFRDANIIMAGLTSQSYLCFTVTGGGVVLLEPGLNGPCFCPATLTGVVINGPANVTEGTTGSYWGTASFTNAPSSNFTNSIWETSNTNRFPITTNGVLTAGSVTSNTPVSVTAFFSYLGIVRSTNKAVTILNLPPPSLGSSVRLSDRNIQFSLSGVVGRQHVIEATTNLSSTTNWIALTTNAVSPSGALLFTDRNATNFQQRFYRAREF